MFVWYRVPREREGAVVAAMRAMHSQWRDRWPGLQCELLRRDDVADAEVTLMEVYRHADGIASEWQACIEAEAGAVVASRHVEVFEPCA